MTDEETPFSRAMRQAEQEQRVLAYLNCGGRNGKRRCRRNWGAYVLAPNGVRTFLLRGGHPTCVHTIDLTGGSVDLDALDALVDEKHPRPPVYWLRPIPAPRSVTEASFKAQREGRGVADLQAHPLPPNDALPWGPETQRDMPRPS
jgi:hypothetical protein